MRSEPFPLEVRRYTHYCASCLLERAEKCMCRDNVLDLSMRLYPVVEMFTPELELGLEIALDSVAAHLAIYMWRMEEELTAPYHVRLPGHKQLDTARKLDDGCFRN